jgi:hypothetical protein
MLSQVLTDPVATAMPCLLEGSVWCMLCSEGYGPLVYGSRSGACVCHVPKDNF